MLCHKIGPIGWARLLYKYSAALASKKLPSVHPPPLARIASFLLLLCPGELEEMRRAAERRSVPFILRRIHFEGGPHSLPLPQLSAAIALSASPVLFLTIQSDCLRPCGWFSFSPGRVEQKYLRMFGTNETDIVEFHQHGGASASVNKRAA